MQQYTCCEGNLGREKLAGLPTKRTCSFSSLFPLPHARTRRLGFRRPPRRLYTVDRACRPKLLRGRPCSSTAARAHGPLPLCRRPPRHLFFVRVPFLGHDGGPSAQRHGTVDRARGPSNLATVRRRLGKLDVVFLPIDGLHRSTKIQHHHRPGVE